MRKQLLWILPLLLMAVSAWSQPVSRDWLNEDNFQNSAADVNGVLYYSDYQYLMKRDLGDGYSETVKNLQGEAVNLKNVNGILYFTVHKPATDESSFWRSDGTREGTVPLRVFPNTFNQISPLVNIGDVIYFGFQDQLYRSDGTEAGTVLVRDFDNTSNQGFLRLSLVQNTILVSLRKGAEQFELWRSDGTLSGTAFIETLRHIEFLHPAENLRYMVADNGSTGREIWKADATGNFSLVKDLNPGAAHSFTEAGAVSATLNDMIVFSTISPEAVWKTNGTAGGTVELASLAASEIVVSGNAAYFISRDNLWRSDGTTAGTSLLKDFPDATEAPYHLSGLTAHGSTLFFVNGTELWQTDGTVHGTILIKDHGDGYDHATGSMTLISVGEVLYYFASFTLNNYKDDPKLWRYDPSDVWVPTLHLVDAVTDQDIERLHDDHAVFTDQKISIRADASLSTQKVSFRVNDALYRNESQRPFALAGDNSGNYNEWTRPQGTYKISVIPHSASGVAGTPMTLNVTVVDRAQACASGTIAREYWNNVSGDKVSDIPTDIRPTGQETLTIFEGPVNGGTNYGARIRGFICPPVSGGYTFWISSNDHSELWLSSDATPGNKTKIAHVTGATTSRQWDKFPSQKSAAIQLQAGQRYYIEALHKQGVGTDNLAVGWQLPGGGLERPIPGNRLSPFSGNTPPEVEITDPPDGATFQAPATITIKSKASDTDGWVTKVELFAGTKVLTSYAYSEFKWIDVPAGTYELTARATDNDGAATTSEPVRITVNGACTASGTIKRERWSGIQGDRVSDIPIESPPTAVTYLSLFESQVNEGTNYGARFRGFLCPPATGNYTFWISSNDHSELWLSTDDHPDNKVRIAYITGSTASRQWDKFSSQKSEPVTLTKGKKYYIEALHKQGVGTDNLAVGWQLPDGTMERPIAGNRLSPFGQDQDAVSRVTYPADGAMGIDPAVMKVQVDPAMDARRYTLEVSTHADFSGESITMTSVEDYQTSFILKDLVHATTYYARVRTNVSGFGPVTEFTTRDMISSQRLWGLTSMGGREDVGTIFSFSIDSAHFVKHYDNLINRYEYGEGENDYVEYDERFIGSPVAGPEGTLYGQRDHDYSHNMFVMNKEGQVAWLNPQVFIYQGNIMLGSDNHIYITTHDYLAGGTVGKYNIDQPRLSRSIRDFEPREYGRDPVATLLERPDGYLYGAANTGGVNDGGVLYRMRPDGSAFQVIHYFSSTFNGMNPVAGLKSDDVYLYGTTSRGGAVENTGTIFRIKPDGTGFSKLHNFDGSNGRHPLSELLLLNDAFYGTTSEGGTFDLGVIYKIHVDGSGFTVLHHFSGLDGANPEGALVHDREGNLYGTTKSGGLNDLGAIFKIHSNGSGFLKLFDFSTTSGGRPTGSLIIREDTFTPPVAVAQTDQEAMLSISIHPNPSTEHFNVNVMSPGDEPIQLQITDQYGQLVNTYEITRDTPMQVGGDLKRGLYIMKVMQGREIMMQRMVKK